MRDAGALSSVSQGVTTVTVCFSKVNFTERYTTGEIFMSYTEWMQHVTPRQLIMSRDDDPIASDLFNIHVVTEFSRDVRILTYNWCVLKSNR